MDSQSEHRIVVLGGGYAGVMAALRAAGRCQREGITVTLIDAKPAFVERIRLHQLAAGGRVREHPYARLLRGTGARFEQGRALAIDLAGKSIELEHDGVRRFLGYDTLVYALGSHTDRESVPGVRENALTLDFDEAATLKQQLRALPDGARVVVCGGGLTGIEAATEIAESRSDLRIALVERGAFAAAFSEKGRTHLLKRFARLGVELNEQSTVRAVQPGRIVADAGDLPFDLCIWAGSFVAAPLARAAGFAVNERGQILTDTALRSRSHLEVLATGDAGAIEGLPLRMACATAMPLGTRAGENAAATALGGEPEAMRYAYTIWCISLGRHDGLVQFVDARDVPKDRVLTGRAAAMMKESVCRFTTASIALERRWCGSYHWLQGKPSSVRRQDAVLPGGAQR